MNTIVSAQEVTDKLAKEIGILTVNAVMQELQVNKLIGAVEELQTANAALQTSIDQHKVAYDKAVAETTSLKSQLDKLVPPHSNPTKKLK